MKHHRREAEQFECEVRAATLLRLGRSGGALIRMYCEHWVNKLDPDCFVFLPEHSLSLSLRWQQARIIRSRQRFRLSDQAGVKNRGLSPNIFIF